MGQPASLISTSRLNIPAIVPQATQDLDAKKKGFNQLQSLAHLVVQSTRANLEGTVYRRVRDTPVYVPRDEAGPTASTSFTNVAAMAVITMLYAFTINAPAGQDIRETEKPVDHKLLSVTQTLARMVAHAARKRLLTHTSQTGGASVQRDTADGIAMSMIHAPISSATMAEPVNPPARFHYASAQHLMKA